MVKNSREDGDFIMEHAAQAFVVANFYDQFLHDRAFKSEDLRQEALCGLIDAVRDFDPTKGAMSTHIRNRVRTHVLNKMMCSLGPTHVPRRTAVQITQVNRWQDDFVKNHDRKPTDEEMSSGLGVSIATLERLRWAQKARQTCYSDTGEQPTEDGCDTPTGDFSVCGALSVDIVAHRRTMLRTIGGVLGNGVLTSTEKKIISLVYGDDEPDYAIVAKAVSCTPSRAEQIHKTALEKLRSWFVANGHMDRLPPQPREQPKPKRATRAYGIRANLSQREIEYNTLLTPREKEFLVRHLIRQETLVSIGQSVQLSRERVRQIIMIALRNMRPDEERHGSRDPNFDTVFREACEGQHVPSSAIRGKCGTHKVALCRSIVVYMLYKYTRDSAMDISLFLNQSCSQAKAHTRRVSEAISAGDKHVNDVIAKLERRLSEIGIQPITRGKGKR